MWSLRIRKVARAFIYWMYGTREPQSIECMGQGTLNLLNVWDKGAFIYWMYGTREPLSISIVTAGAVYLVDIASVKVHLPEIACVKSTSLHLAGDPITIVSLHVSTKVNSRLCTNRTAKTKNINVPPVEYFLIVNATWLQYSTSSRQILM